MLKVFTANQKLNKIMQVLITVSYNSESKLQRYTTKAHNQFVQEFLNKSNVWCQQNLSVVLWKDFVKRLDAKTLR